MKVAIIGTGNAATVLGRKISNAGHEIVQVAGRKVEDAHALGNLLHCQVVYNTRYLTPFAELYIVAVSDTELPAVAARLKLHGKTIVHTAAAVSKDVLSQCSSNYGVLYPLQTLRKENSRIPPTPVLIDASNEETRKMLMNFADTWAENVSVATDEERLKLHVAAVFANNFANHLFAIVANYCKTENLKFSLLLPLIEETARTVQQNIPAQVQTGPAVRQDLATIEKHLQLLSAYPQMQQLYSMLNDSIIQFHQQHEQ